MKWWNFFQGKLGDPDLAQKVDPFIFGPARMIEQVVNSLRQLGIYSSADTAEAVIVLKMTIGIFWLAFTLALAIYAVKKKSHHWWPVIVVCLVWSSACIVGSKWQQSIMVCAPNPNLSGDKLPQDPAINSNGPMLQMK